MPSTRTAILIVLLAVFVPIFIAVHNKPFSVTNISLTPSSDMPEATPTEETNMAPPPLPPRQVPQASKMPPYNAEMQDEGGHSGATYFPRKRQDPSTIQGKFMVGYQGWFTCPGDGPPLHPDHHGWLHWLSSPLPSPDPKFPPGTLTSNAPQGQTNTGRVTFDLWPATDELEEDELFEIPGLSLPPKVVAPRSGRSRGGLNAARKVDVEGQNQEEEGKRRPAKVFSSRHPRTVRRHFRWMREHEISGVFLQRFLSETLDPPIRSIRNEVTARVRESAEAEGRVWSVMYDVSGVRADLVEGAVKEDWRRLVEEEQVLDSEMYLLEGGKPVIAIWGFGISGQHHDPQSAIRLLHHLKTTTPGGAYIFLGVPAFWRTHTNDCDPDPGLEELYLAADCLSPWYVGRFSDTRGSDDFRGLVKDDKELLQERQGRYGKTDFAQVVFPGFSWNNLHGGKLNEIPRQNAGEFLWQQLYNARMEGINIIYGAMFDEYDEATALMPAEPLKANIPTERHFLSLDADGEVLPADWYLRICGFAAISLVTGNTLNLEFPKELLEEFYNFVAALPAPSQAALPISAVIADTPAPPVLPQRPLVPPALSDPNEGFFATARPPVIPPRPAAVCAVPSSSVPAEQSRKLPPNPYAGRVSVNAPPPQRGRLTAEDVYTPTGPPPTALDRAQQEAEGVYSKVMTKERRRDVQERKEWVQEAAGKIVTKEREQQALKAIETVGGLGYKAFMGLAAKANQKQ